MPSEAQMSAERYQQVTTFMVQRTPTDLRDSAASFRELASEGEDERLRSALLLPAEEFDREADLAATGEG
jgi:hypothetical protein